MCNFGALMECTPEGRPFGIETLTRLCRVIGDHRQKRAERCREHTAVVGTAVSLKIEHSDPQSGMLVGLDFCVNAGI